METGDPKQVAVLAVVAVGALGFLSTRLGHRATPQPGVVAAAKGGAPSVGPLTYASIRDSFSHPKLAPKEAKPPVEAVPSIDTKPTVLGGIPSSGLPPVENGLSVPVAVAKPSEAKEPPKVKEEPPALTITLEAIAAAPDAVAFLSVGGKESRPYHPNDRIEGAVRLLRVEDGEIVLRGPQGELTLGVGERKTL